MIAFVLSRAVAGVLLFALLVAIVLPMAILAGLANVIDPIEEEDLDQ